MNVMLSSGGVLSAEVPQTLANLTRALEESGQVEEFRKQNPKEALNWLKNHIPKVFKDVNKFLDEHGHRAIMEVQQSYKTIMIFIVIEKYFKRLVKIVLLVQIEMYMGEGFCHNNIFVYRNILMVGACTTYLQKVYESKRLLYYY